MKTKHIIFLAGAMVVLIPALFVGTTIVQSRPAAVAINEQEKAAGQIASKYLSALADKQFGEAHDYLAPSAKQRIPLAEFNESKGQQAWVFWSLETVTANADRATARLRYKLITPSPDLTAEKIRQLPEQHGDLTLVRIAGQWYVADPEVR